MAVIVLRENAKATWLTGVAALGAKTRDLVRRGTAYAAAAVLFGAVGAALVQLVAQMLSFPAPIAATAITLITAALLHGLLRHLRTQAGRRYGPRSPHKVQ
jgi:hypothetical protein